MRTGFRLGAFAAAVLVVAASAAAASHPPNRYYHLEVNARVYSRVDHGDD